MLWAEWVAVCNEMPSISHAVRQWRHVSVEFSALLALNGKFLIQARRNTMRTPFRNINWNWKLCRLQSPSAVTARKPFHGNGDCIFRLMTIVLVARRRPHRCFANARLHQLYFQSGITINGFLLRYDGNRLPATLLSAKSTLTMRTRFTAYAKWKAESSSL